MWKFLSSCAVTCKYLSVQNFKHTYFVNLQNCYDYDSLCTKTRNVHILHSQFIIISPQLHSGFDDREIV